MKARREVATIAQHATEPSDSHGPCDHGPSCEGRWGHTALPSNSQRGHKNETPFNRFKTGARGTPGAQLHTRKRPCGRFIRKICAKIKLNFWNFKQIHAPGEFTVSWVGTFGQVSISKPYIQKMKCSQKRSARYCSIVQLSRGWQAVLEYPGTLL